MGRKSIAVDLFSGCGGLSWGFQKVGFDIVSVCDNWKPAIDTYERNFDHTVTDTLAAAQTEIVKPPFYVPLPDRVSGTGGRMFRA
jgi:site-specific DNA-cytosine methylase